MAELHIFRPGDRIYVTKSKIVERTDKEIILKNNASIFKLNALRCEGLENDGLTALPQVQITEETKKPGEKQFTPSPIRATGYLYEIRKNVFVVFQISYSKDPKVLREF